MLEHGPFNHPNTLESIRNGSKSAFSKPRPNVAFYETSAAFCIPLNIVENRFNNGHAGQADWSGRRLRPGDVPSRPAAPGENGRKRTACCCKARTQVGWREMPTARQRYIRRMTRQAKRKAPAGQAGASNVVL